MFGLGFFACDRCDTVFASPEEPLWCDSFDDGFLEEIAHQLQANAYFMS